MNKTKQKVLNKLEELWEKNYQLVKSYNLDSVTERNIEWLALRADESIDTKIALEKLCPVVWELIRNTAVLNHAIEMIEKAETVEYENTYGALSVDCTIGVLEIKTEENRFELWDNLDRGFQVEIYKK